jgi:hypothetical protein
MKTAPSYTENSSRMDDRMDSKRQKSVQGKGGRSANTTPLSANRFLTVFNPILEPILELLSVYFYLFSPPPPSKSNRHHLNFDRAFVIAICCILFLGKLSANEEIAKQTAPYLHCTSKISRLVADVNWSYYLPISNKVRQIYDSGGLNWNFSLSILLFRNLYLWESFDYFNKTGSSINGGQKTSLTILPFTLGLKFIYPIGNYRIHLAGGGKYYFVFNQNSSSYVDRKIDLNGLGGAAELGFSRLFWESLQISIYGNYSFIDLKKNKTSKTNVFIDRADLSGFYLGGGIGFCF